MEQFHRLKEHLEQILLLDQLLLELEEEVVVQHLHLLEDPEVKMEDLLAVDRTEHPEDLLLHLLMELVQQLKVMLVELEILQTKAAAVAAALEEQVEICLAVQLEAEETDLLQI